MGREVAFSACPVAGLLSPCCVSVRPQWDVQTFEDTHGVRKVSNLQQWLAIQPQGTCDHLCPLFLCLVL